MNAYIAQIRMNLRLTKRDRSVLFFNYIFPLIFFFMFGQMMHAGQGGAQELVKIVLTISILGAGFFGAGMRAVSDREQNILRRFKVAPISAAPILVASLVTGLLQFLPVAAGVIILAHDLYGMPWPAQPVSLFVFLTLGMLAFRAMGGIIGAVANSMQESQIIIQILYFPMLLASGATIPLTIMPIWLQLTAQFLPATHLAAGMQGILLGSDTLATEGVATGALLLTALLGTLLGVKLFRWEKEEKLRGSAKLWVLGVMGPFFLVGAWQLHARTNLERAKIASREIDRNTTTLIQNARLFLGDGTVVDQGGVLVKDGKISRIYRGQAPDAKSLNAELIEGSGKTLLPGLIDVHVHLGSPGGFFSSDSDYQDADKYMSRELAAYLYSGVTSVKSVGDATDAVLKQRTLMASGENLGAQLFLVGPMFTAPGGHGTEYAKYVPENFRAQFQQQMVRLPKTPEEARKMVDDLKAKGVDGIKAILERGGGSTLFNRLDPLLLKAIVAEAHADHLPVVCHTGDAQDVADALDAGVDGIEHGSMRDEIPAALFERMKQSGTTYDPTLTVAEAFSNLQQGRSDLLEGTLVQQVAPPGLLNATKKMLAGPEGEAMRKGFQSFPISLDIAKKNLAAAYHAGILLVTGTDSGNPTVIHGPAVHRELQLWVQAGIPAAVALEAATHNGSVLLGAGNRIGMIKEGYDADLLLVDGNPLQDVSSTERIAAVFLRGEHINRSELFNQQ